MLTILPKGAKDSSQGKAGSIKQILNFNFNPKAEKVIFAPHGILLYVWEWISEDPRQYRSLQRNGRQPAGSDSLVLSVLTWWFSAILWGWRERWGIKAECWIGPIFWFCLLKPPNSWSSSLPMSQIRQPNFWNPSAEGMLSHLLPAPGTSGVVLQDGVMFCHRVFRVSADSTSGFCSDMMSTLGMMSFPSCRVLWPVSAARMGGTAQL